MTFLLLNILSAFLFVSPVNFPITLAGNFGEPRPNHFHGGIDIKTAQVEGKLVHSIGDGYVSRVTVGLYGFGNAVYIQHPNGYTSIYCHLKSFTPYLNALVRKSQYAKRSSVIDVRFSPTDYPVASNQIIALSGNTGASVAPHLHLEIHKTLSDDLVDPLDFIDADIVDTTPPLGHGFMATPIEGEGVFQNKATKQVFAFTSHVIQQTFTAWGRIGFGIWANDYMEGSFGNKYGIKETVLLVDGKEVFHSNVSNIPSAYNRMVNSWGDYHHYLHSNVWYMRSFLEEGNRLPCISVDDNRGIVNFNEVRDYNLCYIIKDVFGNSSKYEFTVKGQPAAIPKPPKKNSFFCIYPNIPSYINIKGISLILRDGVVAKTTSLTPQFFHSNYSYSDCIRFSNQPQPLFSDATLIMPLKKQVVDTNKLYVVGHFGIDRPISCRYKDGNVYAYIRELSASYEVDYDDTAPLLFPINEIQWSDSGIFTFGLSDSQSGISKYEAYVDSQFVLLEPVPKSSWVRCRLIETPVRRLHRNREIKVVVYDNVGNENSYSTMIYY